MRKILIIVSFLLICCIFSLYIYADDADLDAIIKKVMIQQERIEKDINDMVFKAYSVYYEKNDSGAIEKKVQSYRNIYRKNPDKVYAEYTSMSINDKELSKDEIKRQIEEQKKMGRKNDRMISPFSPRMKDNYEFSLIGSEKINNSDVWAVGFKSKERKEEYGDGKAYISKEHFNVVQFEFTPAKVPGVIKTMKMKVIFFPVDGYWVPLKFEMKMHLKVEFILTLADKNIDIEDNYSDYKLNTGLKDEFFIGKD